MITLRAATPDDAGAIAAIYAPNVTDGIVSLETVPPDAAAMRARIAAVLDGGYPYLVAEEAGAVLGYASAGRFHERPGYRFTVLTSVYVAAAARRRGGARMLYAALIAALRERGFEQAIAQISLPNDASVRLHAAFGYEAVGVHRGVGRKFGRWVDVGLWQLGLAGE